MVAGLATGNLVVILYHAGKKVIQLEYEAYTKMALKQLKSICRDARQKCHVCKMAIVHRTG